MNVTIVGIKSPKIALALPIFTSSVPAGFPSPADDYTEDNLDLNEYLIKHPTATFYVRASGTSMINAGILDKALLIVDKSVEPCHGDIIIAAVNGELTCKILDQQEQVLRAANSSYQPIPISASIDFIVLGVVIHVVNQLCTRW